MTEEYPVTKLCPKCQKEKPVGDFYRFAQGTRISPACKECTRAATIARTQAIKAGTWKFGRKSPGPRKKPEERASKHRHVRNPLHLEEPGCPCFDCKTIRGGTREDRAELIARVAREMGVGVSNTGTSLSLATMSQEEFAAHHEKIRQGRKREGDTVPFITARRGA